MDSRDLSLADFADKPDLDIMGLALSFKEYIGDIYAKKQLQIRRVSLTGSGPEMDVISYSVILNTRFAMARW